MPSTVMDRAGWRECVYSNIRHLASTGACVNTTVAGDIDGDIVQNAQCSELPKGTCGSLSIKIGAN